MSKKIDLRMIKYFYEDRGDPTRCSDWDLKAIKEQYPELAHAYEQMILSRNIFGMVLEQTWENSETYE